ncbi:MAG: glycosyltransferase family 2 protein, partial [Asgard group archaeon]|nr:glycosyltransferase family 2 protein [Asgard group archaeon]
MNYKTRPIISVLVTAHNREKYICEAIESILESTFKDYEIIVVDDCSVDKTYEMAKRYEKLDRRIKVFRNNKNLGQFENRNYAASLAKGLYIKYLDSDDVIYPFALETMLNYMKQFPEAGLAISHTSLHDKKPYPILLLPKEAYRSFFLTGGFPNSGPSAAIIKTKVFADIGGFSKTPYVGSDTELWLQIAAKYPIVKMPPSLIWYRRHDDQEIVKGVSSYSYLRESFPYFLKILKSSLCPLSQKEINVAISKLKLRHS